MSKLLEELNNKFDEYHKKQLEINNKQDPDYYLFMGKANAMGEAIDLIENNNDWILGCPNKEGGEFWVMIQDVEYPVFVTSVNCYDEFWGDISGDTICFKQSQITHYQPIIKPDLPTI